MLHMPADDPTDAMAAGGLRQCRLEFADEAHRRLHARLQIRRQRPLAEPNLRRSQFKGEFAFNASSYA
jgi:hypothetical protein